MSTLNLPVMIRVYYVVDPNGSPCSPFTSTDDVENDIETILKPKINDAVAILNKLGVGLILHPDGFQKILSEDLFHIDYSNYQDLINLGWEPRQSWINVYFTKTLFFGDDGTTYGLTVINGTSFMNQIGYGVLLSGSSDAPTMAHELGHMFGLPHTFRVNRVFETVWAGEIKFVGFTYDNWAEPDDRKFSTMAMIPFEDDTMSLNNKEELIVNPMSYFLDIGADYNVEDFEYTSNQILRAQLTIISRRSSLAYYINGYAPNPNYPPLPDFCPAFAAAWMG